MIKAKEILSKQCNRYVNGLCTSGVCITRGAQQRNITDITELYWSLSTCEAHEAILELDSLLNKKNE